MTRLIQRLRFVVALTVCIILSGGEYSVNLDRVFGLGSSPGIPIPRPTPKSPALEPLPEETRAKFGRVVIILGRALPRPHYGTLRSEAASDLPPENYTIGLEVHLC